MENLHPDCLDNPRLDLTPRMSLQARESRFQDYSFIARASRHVLNIEILKQWNRILSRDASQILKGAHVNQPIRFMFVSILNQQLLEGVQRS